MGKLIASPRRAVHSNLVYDCTSDPKEGSVPATIRIPQSLVDMLERVLRNPSLANGRSGLIRWCLWYGLSKVAEDIHDDRLSDELRLVMDLSERYRHQRVVQHYKAMLRETGNSITELLSEGMIDAARELWDSTYQTVDAMADPHWKKRFLDLLNQEDWKDLVTRRPDPPRLVTK